MEMHDNIQLGNQFNLFIVFAVRVLPLLSFSQLS